MSLATLSRRMQIDPLFAQHLSRDTEPTLAREGISLKPDELLALKHFLKDPNALLIDPSNPDSSTVDPWITG